MEGVAERSIWLSCPVPRRWEGLIYAGILVVGLGLGGLALSGVIGGVLAVLFIVGLVLLVPLSMVVILMLVWLVGHVVWGRNGRDWWYLAVGPDVVGSEGGHDVLSARCLEMVSAQELEWMVIEGHLGLAAWDEAGRGLLGLDVERFESRRGLEMRIRLAVGMGRHGLAKRLRSML